MASEFPQGYRHAWGQERELVDGAPPPRTGIRSDAHGLRTRMADHAERARAHLRETGFPVHKEFGDSVTTLGGDPPCVVAAPPKRWLAIECCWELAQRGRGLPRQVGSVIRLCSWVFMVRRGGLSTFQEVYKWCRLNRECQGALVIPWEVRRELAVAATLVLLVEQILDSRTCSTRRILAAGSVRAQLRWRSCSPRLGGRFGVVGSRRSGIRKHFRIYPRLRKPPLNSRSSLRFHVP